MKRNTKQIIFFVSLSVLSLFFVNDFCIEIRSGSLVDLFLLQDFLSDAIVLLAFFTYVASMVYVYPKLFPDSRQLLRQPVFLALITPVFINLISAGLGYLSAFVILPLSYLICLVLGVASVLREPNKSGPITQPSTAAKTANKKSKKTAFIVIAIVLLMWAIAISQRSAMVEPDCVYHNGARFVPCPEE